MSWSSAKIDLQSNPNNPLFLFSFCFGNAWSFVVVFTKSIPPTSLSLEYVVDGNGGMKKN